MEMVNVVDVATDSQLCEMFDYEEITVKVREEIRALSEQCPDTNFSSLYHVCRENGDMEQANKYLNMIQDEMFRLSTAMLWAEKV